MQLHVVRPLAPRPPNDPRVVASMRQMIVDARDAARVATVSTTAAGGIDPLQTFWMHRAIASLGRAAGLMQAVAGLTELTRIHVPVRTYGIAFEESRARLTEATELVAAGNRASAVELVAAVNQRLRFLDSQFRYDIARFDPKPQSGM